MLKIYGNDFSIFSNKIKFVAGVLDLSYDFIKINIPAGDNKTPEYLAIHPAGKIPAIDDDGFILFESDSIITYLADKKGDTPLYPKNLQKRALVNQWINFGTIHIGGSIIKIAFNRVFAPKMGLPIDERSIKDGENFLKRFFPVLETQLEGNKYLTGDQITLADINILAIMDVIEIANIDITPYFNLIKWRDGLRTQEFYTDPFNKALAASIG